MTDSTLAPDELPEAPEPAPYAGDMTVVARVVGLDQALAIKGCLLAAGVPAVLGDHNLMMQGNAWLGNVGGDVRVLVPEAMAARAKQVIAEFRDGAFEIEGDPDPELAPPTTATDLALWGPDLAAFLSLLLTPVFGATLHWLNSRRLGVPALARQADAGLALSVLATAAAFWLMRDHDWHMMSPFLVSVVMGVYTAAWYLLLAHPQSRYIARSFGHKYRPRSTWRAAGIVFVAMLAIGFIGERLRLD